MSKCKMKKIARVQAADAVEAQVWHSATVDLSQWAKDVKKQVKSERDAAAKRAKRAAEKTAHQVVV